MLWACKKAWRSSQGTQLFKHEGSCSTWHTDTTLSPVIWPIPRTLLLPKKSLRTLIHNPKKRYSIWKMKAIMPAIAHKRWSTMLQKLEKCVNFVDNRCLRIAFSRWNAKGYCPRTQSHSWMNSHTETTTCKYKVIQCGEIPQKTIFKGRPVLNRRNWALQ